MPRGGAAAPGDVWAWRPGGTGGLMFLVFRLPLILAETAARQGLAVAGAVLRLLRGGDADDDRVEVATPGAAPRHAADRRAAAPPADAPSARAPRGPAPSARPTRGPAPAPAPPTAEEAIARRRGREAAAAPARPARPAAAPARPARNARRAAAPPPPAPAPAPAAPEADHVDREATVVDSRGPADSPGASLQIDAPWEGYD